MSFDQKFQGKLVWGTSVFRILLETDNKKLKKDFSGTLTLFERRHERDRFNFKSLTEFISVTRNLWKESLRSESVQDTRLSRWIEELFNELHISANYQEILDAIRGDFVEVPALEVGETEILPRDRIDEILPATDEFMAKGTTQKITGNFDDKQELDNILNNFLGEHKPERSTQALSFASFTTADGQTRSIEEHKEITPQALDDNVKLESGFSNDFGVQINDISFTDTIPFDYQIKDIAISGVQAEKINQQVTEDGLAVEWKIDHLDPGQESKIEYEMGKRMLRTILIRDDFDLTILQTYENINKDQNSVWVESTYIFQQNTPVVENVKILDQIPGDYTLIDSTPEAIPPLALVTSVNQATEISWSYTNVPASTQFVLTYELANSPKILRDRAQIYDKNDELVLEGVRILRPDKNGFGYGVVLAVQAHKSINSTLKLIELLPAAITIEQIKVEIGNFAELTENSQKRIVWQLENIEPETIYEILLKYRLQDSYHFNNFSIELGGIEIVKEDSNDVIKKDEKIILPAEIYE